MATAHLRRGRARGDRRGDAARRDRVGGRRGPRPRRRVRPVQGPGRGVRARAHRRRADLGGLHHGRRRRRRHDGHAADRRAAGSPTSRCAPSTSSSTRPPRRASCSAARDACRSSCASRSACGAPPPPSTPNRSRAGTRTSPASSWWLPVDAGRQQGPAQGGDPLRRPRRLPGAQEPVAARRRGARRRPCRRDRQGARGARRQGPHDRVLVGRGAHLPRRRRGAGQATASTPR